MTDDRSQRARAAAEAGTATRDRKIQDALDAYYADSQNAFEMMPLFAVEVEQSDIPYCRTYLDACIAHLDELARLIAQRDGYADPRQGYLRELTEGDAPGVALNGWGSKR